MTDANTLSCPTCGGPINIEEAEPLARVPCPKCGARVRASRSFDHFELLETLGTGGMGTVYKARDTHLDREVAIKVLRKDLGPEYVDQLQQEARVTASINHPNVVQVFSFGRAHNQYYLVMELVDRGTLDDLIEQRKKLPEEDVLRAGIEVARGLRAAFHKGLIHRDVKPANILFASDGTAKISDFGLAGVADSLGQNASAIWGTPYYVAPERLSNSPEDFRSDIYSLGATLFHAVGGCPPFKGESTSAADLRALKDSPLKLAEVAPDVSSATAGVIGRMIAPDPRLRYHSYDSVIAALEKSRRILLGEQRPVRTKLLLLTVALVLMAMAAAGWFFSRHARSVSGMVTPAAAATASRIDVNRQFEDARRQLIDGGYTNARAAFARLAEETKNKQPIYDWARLNQALAALLDHEPSQMTQALQEVENAGTTGFADRQLGAFLLETARRANAHSTIALSDVPQHAARPFALFFLGLVDVDLGRFSDAVALLEAFMHAQPAANFSWMTEYKPLAQKYLDDSRAWLAWRDRRGTGKSAAEVRRALDSLRALIPKLQKGTAISHDAGIEEKFLANRLGGAQSASKAQPEQGREAMSETAEWNAALEDFRRATAVYDFVRGASSIRKARVTEPSLKRLRADYDRLANWLLEWKVDLIRDLNTRGYNERLAVGDVEYLGVVRANASSLRLRNAYGFTELDWVQVPPRTLLSISSALAANADQKWRCGVFAWATGQTEAAKQLFDSACASKPSYNEARQFFEPKQQ